MQRIDERPIRGEFKVWIWKNYLAPSLHFLLMVDVISESSVLKIQKKITKFIKKWLNLPRCCTLSAVFHPDVLNLPFLPQARESAKLSMIIAIEQSKDPLITECMSLLKNPDFLSRNEIPQNSISLLEAARKSALSTSKVTKFIKTFVRNSLHQSHIEYWNNTLDHLQVQSKFRDIVTLEPKSHTWNRLVAGLPAGQLSFLLRAGTDCLPTPLNLRRWKYQVSTTCPLCNSPYPTTAHILNSCQEALNQGRFTWRHDSVLNCLTSLVKPNIPSSCKFYVDLPGLRANESPPATIPIDVSTTTARPDLVLVSGSNITMLELTIPTNSSESIQAARARKLNKLNYQHLISDLESGNFHVSFNTLEIGSLGHYEQEAVYCLRHTFNLSKCDTNQILLKLSRIAVGCSYHIFNCRNSQSWDLHKPYHFIS